MKEWKQRDNVKQVHEDLYNLSDPNDPSSEQYIALIVKSVFAEKDRTHANAIWVQSVLEIIFDKRHLTTKIETDAVESQTEAITDTEQVTLYNLFV